MSEKEEKTAEKEEPKDLEALFDVYARFGDRESDGTITLKNIDKWLKQAELLNKKGGVSNADTAITFSKIMKNKKRMNFGEFQEFIEALANDKKTEASEFIEKLVAAGEPKLSSVTTPITGGAVGRNLRRMTDTTQYTGAHKERFDEEGKGRGKEGRVSAENTTGYVTGYKKDKKGDDDDNKGEDEDKKKKK